MNGNSPRSIDRTIHEPAEKSEGRTGQDHTRRICGIEAAWNATRRAPEFLVILDFGGRRAAVTIPPNTRVPDALRVRFAVQWPCPLHSLRSRVGMHALGQPPLGDYLSYVRKTVLDGGASDRAELVNEWRTANDRFYDLEENEAGFADGGELRDLDPSLTPLMAEIERNVRFARAFDSLPSRFAMVELDRLVVEQPHINLHHVERLKARLSASATQEELFRFCLPLDRSPAGVKVRRTGSKKFLFWSESSDFRFLEAVQLQDHQIVDFQTYGSIGAMIGLVVGFGSNFLCAIESEKRLLLHNGHHRAYALRDLGFTHVPCIFSDLLGDALGAAALRPRLRFRRILRHNLLGLRLQQFRVAPEMLVTLFFG